MAHILWPRWPDLSQYPDTYQIESHWPTAQATQYCIAPAINVWFGGDARQPDPIIEWKMGKRLKSARGARWAYKATEWDTGYEPVILEIWMYCTKRTDHWEFAIDAFLFNPEYAPLAHGDIKIPYAGPGYTNAPVWVGPRTFLMDSWWGLPHDAQIIVQPVRLEDMLPEEPQPLGDRTEARSTAP